MNLTRLSLGNPVAVIAAVLLVVLMGGIGLASLPVQMIPDVQRPFIQINTGWRAAAPEEVESEIIEPQEDMLRGLPGLEICRYLLHRAVRACHGAADCSKWLLEPGPVFFCLICFTLKKSQNYENSLVQYVL